MGHSPTSSQHSGAAVQILHMRASLDRHSLTLLQAVVYGPAAGTSVRLGMIVYLLRCQCFCSSPVLRRPLVVCQRLGGDAVLAASYAKVLPQSWQVWVGHGFFGEHLLRHTGRQLSRADVVPPPLVDGVLEAGLAVVLVCVAPAAAANLAAAPPALLAHPGVRGCAAAGVEGDSSVQANKSARRRRVDERAEGQKRKKSREKRWSREKLAKTKGGSGESDTNNEGNDHTGRRITLGRRARERIKEGRDPGKTRGEPSAGLLECLRK
ncbi:hypothetical protein EMIHUDRAFT_79032 [Emiliania huxleyi CCMP1516]|uniref:Uncharacterized protein n=2 Tax=Emiliania huxleyi TaxID=2903 RepID=A0A0D3KLQ0_EMIH1|nr:hypothetical protein EMIHUDRAFT_79032 [Emiliania huxleyi CCMP1516]EOD36685.1 hypothetical protein EMIHUDRAFT_79032 [Emiliania huxleyi CCMP1516]|eukprot:XP_005789114.1 hypothetical protein EMIHUDRAFT_79032 [Emiliania huxleyi CCMP1516]